MMRAGFAVFVALSASATSAQVPATSPVQFDPRFAPMASGSWTFVTIPGGSEAVFVGATGIRQLSLRCTKATRLVTLAKPVGPGATSLNLWSTDGLRAVAGRLDPATSTLSVDLNARDPILDQMAFSRGRFSVSAVGSPPLVVPAWPEAARAIEDCRI